MSAAVSQKLGPLEGIPLPLLQEARDAGLRDELIGKAWAAYVDWHCSTFGPEADFRRRDWTRQIAWTKRDEEESVPTTSEVRMLAREQDAERRKAREDEAYRQQALSFRQWKAQDPEQAAKLEHALMVLGI